jgi:hypothetical protein
MRRITYAGRWVLLWLAITAGVALAQDAPPQQAPLTAAEVRSYIESLPDTRVRVFVNQRKVDFDLTPELEAEFKKMGASQETIDQIRLKRAPQKATLDIGCKPVECSVFINDTLIGATAQGRLKKADQDPTKIAVTVKSAGFKDQMATVQLVANRTTTYEFTLESDVPPPAPRTSLPPRAAVTPAPRAETPAPPRAETPAAPPNEIPAVAKNDAPPPTARPVPTPPPIAPVAPPPAPAAADIITPQQVFNRVVEACGGLANLKGFSRFVANGQLVLDNGHGSQSDALLKESVIYPNNIKWELKVAGVGWTLTSGADEAWSDGDQKLRGSELGTELERNIKVFVSMQLPGLLMRLQDKDVKLSVNREGDQTVLIGQSTDDKYTIYLDSSNRPVRVAYEALTGLGAKAEMQYSRYDATIKLPMSMTLRYPARSGYGQEVRYSKIDPNVQPKDGEFKRRGGLLGVLPSK